MRPVRCTIKKKKRALCLLMQWNAFYRGGPSLVVHTFSKFFGLENGPVTDKSQEKTLFGKDFSKPAKTQL